MARSRERAPPCVVTRTLGGGGVACLLVLTLGCAEILGYERAQAEGVEPDGSSDAAVQTDGESVVDADPPKDSSDASAARDSWAPDDGPSTTDGPTNGPGYRYYQLRIASVGFTTAGNTTLLFVEFRIDGDWPMGQFSGPTGQLGAHTVTVLASSTHSAPGKHYEIWQAMNGYPSPANGQGALGTSEQEWLNNPAPGWSSAVGRFAITAPYDHFSGHEWLQLDFGTDSANAAKHVKIDGLGVWSWNPTIPNFTYPHNQAHGADDYALFGSNDALTWVEIVGSRRRGNTSGAQPVRTSWVWAN